MGRLAAKLTAFAAALNAWLTPTTRKTLHGLVALVAAVLGIWGLSTDTIQLWVAVVIAAGGLGSAVLSAIVTHRPDMAVLYATASGLIATLVAVRIVVPSLAGQIDATLAAVVAFTSTLAYTRTDTSTLTGAPSYEPIPPDPAPPARAVVPDPTPVSATSNPDRSVTVKAADGTTTTTPGV